ncbi:MULTISPECIES: DUF1850 domain-containing protein [unclassified Chelatococcus]|uniref:DUF1850 domain-containing protein n=1 Tax=unclassified Chelatococcus TaxID=2638111 RepID=UPI000363B96F|nr:MULTISPECIES: DUF1850 domain-containing protein [unclassified Chelatococcus]ALA16654.1 hypothetical protein AL346_03530 [Chelatococcus sp. CO-6]
MAHAPRGTAGLGRVSGLCLAAAGLVVHLGTAALTLGWTHSVEKTVWEEDWRLTEQGLVIAEARVKGSGAGMDPAPDARLIDGFWRWTPSLPPQDMVVMRRSQAVADWYLCVEGACRPLERLVPQAADPVTLRACDRP